MERAVLLRLQNPALSKQQEKGEPSANSTNRCGHRPGSGWCPENPRNFSVHLRFATWCARPTHRGLDLSGQPASRRSRPGLARPPESEPPPLTFVMSAVDRPRCQNVLTPKRRSATRAAAGRGSRNIFSARPTAPPSGENTWLRGGRAPGGGTSGVAGRELESRTGAWAGT